MFSTLGPVGYRPTLDSGDVLGSGFANRSQGCTLFIAFRRTIEKYFAALSRGNILFVILGAWRGAGVCQFLCSLWQRHKRTALQDPNPVTVAQGSASPMNECAHSLRPRRRYVCPRGENFRFFF
jgi:hypothetical protein